MLDFQSFGVQAAGGVRPQCFMRRLLQCQQDLPSSTKAQEGRLFAVADWKPQDLNPQPLNP